MRAAVLAMAIFGASLAAGPAGAQMPPPPPSPEASEIAACLCLQRGIAALRGDAQGRQSSYESTRSEVARLDAELAHERAHLDVNNPEAVARFRQLLEHRDAIARRSTGVVAHDAMAASGRYNAKVDEYNARCANRPRDPILLNRVEMTLSCPPL